MTRPWEADPSCPDIWELTNYWTAISNNNMANVLIELERFDEAIALLNKALTVYRRVSAYSSEGDALRGLSHASRSIAEVAKANEFINGALSIAQEHRNSAWEGFWLLECGQVKLSQDDPAGALVAYRRAAVLQRQLGDRIREAVVFDATGEAYQRLGRYDEAVEFHRFAVSAFRELNEKWHLAIALERLAVALANGEESAAAETHLREALALFATFGDAGSARHRTRIETALARASRVDHQSCRIAHTAIRPASSLAVSAGSVRLMSSDAMSVSSATGSTIR